jgi:hypothetical protein
MCLPPVMRFMTSLTVNFSANVWVAAKTNWRVT